MIKLLSSCVLLSLALASLGCIGVKPYERTRLAHPFMQNIPRLGDKFHGHVLPIREGAVGGEGKIGGGCGCN